MNKKKRMALYTYQLRVQHLEEQEQQAEVKDISGCLLGTWGFGFKIKPQGFRVCTLPFFGTPNFMSIVSPIYRIKYPKR